MLDDASLEQPLLRSFLLGLKPQYLQEAARWLHENWDRIEDVTWEGSPPTAVDAGHLISRLRDACDQQQKCTNRDDTLYLHLVSLTSYLRRLESAKTEFDQLRVLASPAAIKFSKGQAANWMRVTPSAIRDDLSAIAKMRDDMVAGLRSAALVQLLHALRGFVLTYASERLRQGRLEFHDLLVQARKLLRENAEVRRSVSQRFRYILIDEFQDTDPLQVEIASLIASEDSSPGRIFFVGDPKQSIYRFRRADIELYQRTQKQHESGLVRLTQNFRSVPSIIAWVNHIFAGLMAAPQPDTVGQAQYTPLDPAREAPHPKSSVHLLGGPRNGSTEDVRRKEAKEIARALQIIKEQGWQVFEEDGARPANYGDIALLLPARTTLPFIEQALEDAAIPYRVESRSLVYDTQEVRDLLSILRSIDDPTDEVALIAALRSPAFACSDRELLAYYRAGGAWDYRRDPPTSLPPRQPVVAAMASLRELHARRWWDTTSGLTEAVIRERRMFELAFASRRPRERWQRLRFVLDQARAFSERGGRTLRQFIDWADRQADEGTRVVETVVPEPDDDAVRIMTIHAAKGLEFPIVLLAGLNVRPGYARNKQATILWDTMGALEARLGSDHATFETPGFHALAEREKVMDELEKVRLLYVAATRARDHLVVSLHHPTGIDCHAKRLHELSLQRPNLSQPLNIDWQLPLATAPALSAPFEDSLERRTRWLQEREERISALASVPAIAATELARIENKVEPVEEEPPWRRGRAGSAIGRAVHAVLQSIDLASGDGLDGAAAAQAAAEGIPGRSAEVARLTSSALRSKVVQQAVASGRYWRELYVGVPLEGMLLEGFIDLLYEAPEGLVIVDYKTDALEDDQAALAATGRYRLQGAAYAVALQQALGRPVARCVFVFTRLSGPVEQDIVDLPAAMESARKALAAARPTRT
jgi:ATP-dependent exoDNAse (exonuclease V) beta subunit